jgi:hypothetical protein
MKCQPQRILCNQAGQSHRRGSVGDTPNNGVSAQEVLPTWERYVAMLDGSEAAASDQKGGSGFNG